MLTAAQLPAVLRSRQESHLSRRCGSDVFGLLAPRRDVALAVQHTPDISVRWTLDVRHQVGIVHQRPETQAAQAKGS